LRNKNRETVQANSWEQKSEILLCPLCSVATLTQAHVLHSLQRIANKNMSAQVEPPPVKKQKCSELSKTCANCAEIIVSLVRSTRELALQENSGCQFGHRPNRKSTKRPQRTVEIESRRGKTTSDNVQVDFCCFLVFKSKAIRSQKRQVKYNFGIMECPTREFKRVSPPKYIRSHFGASRLF